MKHLILIAVLHVLRTQAVPHPSPFEVTDKYVQEYRDEINHLISDSAVHKHHDSSFEDYKDAKTVTDEEHYDFIVIGGGTAGSVIASRLAELPENRVLLLEAGGEETHITMMPALVDTLKHSKYTWGYLAEPSETWCLQHKQCPIPKAKILGGTSSINDPLYVRGNSRDYDLWSDLGNNGWCHGDSLPYFKKSENARLNHFDKKFHNQGGLVSVEEPMYLSKLAHYFLEAGKELGHKVIDYNGKYQLGFSTPQLTTKYGVRHSTFAAYTQRFKDKQNLFIKPHSQVIGIHISTHTKDATGVKFIHGGEVILAKAHKEVILAAGAIATPHLLMLSGIGDKAYLEEMGIESVSDLKGVGHQLRDHLIFSGLNFLLNDSLIEPQLHNDRENLINWLRYGKGPMSTSGIEGLAFLKTKPSRDTPGYPDVQLSYIPKEKSSSLESSINIEVTLLHPKSHGSVKLATKDPLNWPKIHLNHLSDEDDFDIQTMLAGIRLAQKLIDTECFRQIGAILDTAPIKLCEQHAFDSDEYWLCALRHTARTAGHLTGTAAMGDADNDLAVVDNTLRVHGVNKLRVADGSVIPISISGDTTASTVLIAEKAADLIKHDWQ